MSTTTKAAHTPAPWESKKGGRGGLARASGYTELFYLAGPNGEAIGECNSVFGPNEANARLIAAAPEMLEALEKLIAEIERRDNTADEGISAHCLEVMQANAAIQKAKGAE